MKYGLIGEHLGHSFSVVIHNMIGNYGYELKEICKNDIDEFMNKKEFIGINVTIPYKQTIMKFLDEITEEARLIGAVNTVVNKNGKLYGHNTDFCGLQALLKKNNINVAGKKVLICGTGGTSRTAYAVCEKMGAGKIYKLSRSRKEGNITYDEAYSNHADCQIIINTTPCGMYPDIDCAAIDIDIFTHLEAVVDVVYNPLRTKLIESANSRGIKAVGGLYMLVMQAVAAAEFFFGKSISDEKVSQIYGEIVKNKKNIVLIGMPSCGKTTVGKIIANDMGREFYDCDEYLVKEYQREITDIFEKEGEEYFRNIESDVIRKLSMKNGVVISTGGGAVLRSENIEYLKQNGYVVFIDRALENLVPTSDRPTANDFEKIKKRYEERYGLYTKYCDFKVEVCGNANEVANVIKEGFINENFSD